MQLKFNIATKFPINIVGAAIDIANYFNAASEIELAAGSRGASNDDR